MPSPDGARELLLAVDRVVPHTDADGLAAGALALRARGEAAAAAVLLRRGETPFGPEPPLPDGSVAVLDWGVRPLGRAGVLVDHHAPEAERSLASSSSRATARSRRPRRRPSSGGCFRRSPPGWRLPAPSATSATPRSRCPSAPARRAGPSGGSSRS